MTGWHPYFPFPEWRDAQTEALDFILENLDTSDDIFVEAPTGIGKSAIAIALARYVESQGGRTYISTASVQLENQYMNDFRRFGLRQLHSKSWYPCPQCQTCDVGSVIIKRPGERKARRNCGIEPCTYLSAKAEFLTAAISISNSAFLLTNARFIKDWETRSLAIFDEGHLLAETIAGTYKIEVLQRQVDYLPMEGDELAWLQGHYVNWLKREIIGLEEQFQYACDLNNTDEQKRLFKKLENAERRLTNIASLLRDNPNDWVFDLQPDRLVILPLWAKRIAQSLLPRIGRKRVYLSATMPGFRQQAGYLGIDPAHAAHLELDSPFPLQNRLVHVCPLVDWRNPNSAISTLCQVVDRILKLHPADRGLLHVSSYSQARELVARIGGRRLITHDSAREKDVRLEEMFAKPGTVLVSPSSHEGLDLVDDKSRFQIIAKLPFASLGDKRVKRRMAVDKTWYVVTTAEKLIQACGRSIRSETDYAATYLLDEAFDRFFFRQADALGLFPPYFLQSLRIDEVDIGREAFR